MKFSDLKYSPNLHWQYDSGAGLQLYGDIPKVATNHVEYVFKHPQNCSLFTLQTSKKDEKGMAAWMGTIGYERWVQFSPVGWDEMQTANAQAMTHAVTVLPKIIEKLIAFKENQSFYLNNSGRKQLKEILEVAETLEEKK